MRASLAAASVVATAIVIAACGGDGGTDVPVKVFHIAGIAVAPAQLPCAGPAYGYELRFSVKLVNTTDQDIPITKVRASGIVIRATNSLDVGQYVHVQDSLAFVPLTMLAHDGSGTKSLEVTLDTRCGNFTPAPPQQVCMNGVCRSVTIGGGYKDIQTTLWIRTPYGEYEATPVMTHIGYN